MTEWIWIPNQEGVMMTIRRRSTGAPVLGIFDPGEQLICRGCVNFELGLVPLYDNHLVAYAF